MKKKSEKNRQSHHFQKLEVPTYRAVALPKSKIWNAAEPALVAKLKIWARAQSLTAKRQSERFSFRLKFCALWHRKE